MSEWKDIGEYQPKYKSNIQAIGTWYNDQTGAGETECQLVGEYQGYVDKWCGHMLTVPTPELETHLINITHWKELTWP